MRSGTIYPWKFSVSDVLSRVWAFDPRCQFYELLDGQYYNLELSRCIDFLFENATVDRRSIGAACKGKVGGLWWRWLKLRPLQTLSAGQPEVAELLDCNRVDGHASTYCQP